MKKLPSFEKKFADLLPAPRRFLVGARSFLLKLAATGLGALVLSPPASGALNPQLKPAVTISDRQRRSSVGKLVLRLKSRSGAMLASHGSHSSHSSHSSHQSHSSHYSSSTGVVPSSPASPPSSSVPESTPANPAQASTSEVGSFFSEEGTQEVVVTIMKVESTTRTVTGKDEFGTTFVFNYRFETRIHFATSKAGEVDRRIEAAGASLLPIGSRVSVKWRPDPIHHRRMVILFRLL